MTQLTFSDAEYAGKRKRTRREVFLAEMEKVVPCELKYLDQISLRREFAPEVERLSDLLGKDLTHWIDPAGKSTVGQATALRKAAPVPA